MLREHTRGRTDPPLRAPAPRKANPYRHRKNAGPMQGLERTQLVINVLATRYDQTGTSFLGFVLLSCIRLWIRFVHAAQSGQPNFAFNRSGSMAET